MTISEIDEAIRTQQAYLASSAIPNDPELRQSMKLGIEALKRCKYIREEQNFPSKSPLLGETT